MESNMDIINDMFSDNLIYDEQDEINMMFSTIGRFLD